MTEQPVRHRVLHASLYLLALAWVLPFLQPYHRFPITAFYGEWLALALGLAAVVPLLRSGGWQHPEIPVVALLPLGLILLIGLQVMVGRVDYPEQALMAALYLTWTALLITLGRVLRSAFGLAAIADMLAWALIAGALVNAFAGFIQLYDAAGPLRFLFADAAPPAMYGNLQQRNHFAAYLAMGLASVGYQYARGRLAALPMAACFLILLLALALSTSRSSWLYLGCFTLIGLALHRARRDTESRRLAVYCLALWPAFALAQWACTLPLLQPHVGFQTSVQRLFDTGGGIENRLQFARGAWNMFAEAPVAGVGWGQFAWRHFLYLSSSEAAMEPRIVNHAHNIVLHLMAETGSGGVALLAGGAALWLADLKRTHFDPACWWLLALVSVVGVHSLLEFPLWYAYFLGMAAVLVGLGSQRAIPLRRPGAARLVTALFVVSGTIHLAAAIAPYREFEQLIFDPRRGAAQSMTDANFTAAITRLRGEPVLAPYVELAVVLGMDMSRDRLAEKLDLATRAMHFAPVSHLVVRRAMLLALAGDDVGALRGIDRATRAYPDDLETVVGELASAAERYPGEFTPLLELAKIRKAQPRGVGAPAVDAYRR